MSVWRILALVLFAPALAKTDSLSEQIARLPWDAVVQTEATAADAQIKVTAHYLVPQVVDDTDMSYIRVAHAQTSVGPDGRIWIYDSSVFRMKCRDGIGVWCNGGGEVSRADGKGFDYQIRLTWQRNGQPVVHFGETFHCRWVKTQSFDRQGLHLTVEVSIVEAKHP